MGVKASPWRYALPGGKQLLRMYPSLGDVTWTGSVSLPTLTDGPIQVFRYGALTLNGATVTALNKNRGAIIVCDTLTTTGTASTIHMNGKGPTGSTSWDNYDLTIPTAISIASRATHPRSFVEKFLARGYYLGDPLVLPQTYNDMMMSAVVSQGSQKIIDKTQLGSGGGGSSGVGSCGGYYCFKGGDGGAGATGPGGGSSGIFGVANNYTTIYAGAGTAAKSWRGGFAGTGSNNSGLVLSGDVALTNSPGGVLVVIALLSVSLGVGLTLSANALFESASHTNTSAMGGNGGGRVLLLCPSTISSNLTLSATGAEATLSGNCTGTCSAKGGAGAATQGLLSTWGLT